MLQRAEVVAAEIAQAHLDAKLAQAEDEPDPPAEEELLFDVYAHPSPRLSSAISRFAWVRVRVKGTLKDYMQLPYPSES